MIEKEEKSLASAKNDFVKKSIQSRIDALKADLEAALPEALKGEVETELPTPEEVDLNAAENKEEKEVKESLTEGEVRDLTKVNGTYSKLLDKNIKYIFDQVKEGKSVQEMKDLVLSIIEPAYNTAAKKGFIVKLNRQTTAMGVATLCANA
jgi:hypothetical protein